MTITTKHSASSYGIPVIIDDAGKLMDYPDGIRAALDILGWTNAEFAERAGINQRTIEGYRQGRPVQAGPLNVLADALETLENQGKKKLRKKA